MPTKEISQKLARLVASDAFKAVTKAHGSETIMRANDERLRNFPRIRTGVFPVDFSLGGGLPAQHTNMFYGGFSSGKTTLGLQALGRAQHICAKCFTGYLGIIPCKCGDFTETVAAILDVEGTLDMRWAVRQGVDEERVLISRPAYAEQAVDIAEAMVRSGECNFLLVDSLAMLVPSAEIRKSADEFTPGSQAQLIAKMCRKVLAAVNTLEQEMKPKPTIIYINQLSYKVGVVYGSPEVIPGGEKPKFASSTIVKMGQMKTDITDKVTELSIGRSTRFKYRVEKNKTASPKSEGEFSRLLMDTEHQRVGEVDDAEDFTRIMENAGFLEGSGSSYTLFGEKYKGKSPLEELYQKDRIFRERIQVQAMEELAAKGLLGGIGPEPEKTTADLLAEMDKIDDQIAEDTDKAKSKSKKKS